MSDKETVLGVGMIAYLQSISGGGDLYTMFKLGYENPTFGLEPIEHIYITKDGRAYAATDDASLMALESLGAGVIDEETALAKLMTMVDYREYLKTKWAERQGQLATMLGGMLQPADKKDAGEIETLSNLKMGQYL